MHYIRAELSISLFSSITLPIHHFDRSYPILIHLKKDEMDIYSKKSVSLTQEQQISRSQVDLKFSVKFPTFEKDLEFSSKLSFNDLLIYLSTICNKKVYSINIRGKIFDGNDGIEDISIINNEFIIAYISEDEEEYGINYFDLKNRSPNNFYKCRCNEKINDCLKDCFKDKYYFYFPGGCYHIDEDKSWKDYPNFYVSNFGSKISLFGVCTIPEQEEETTQSSSKKRKKSIDSSSKKKKIK